MSGDVDMDMLSQSTLSWEGGAEGEDLAHLADPLTEYSLDDSDSDANDFQEPDSDANDFQEPQVRHGKLKWRDLGDFDRVTSVSSAQSAAASLAKAQPDAGADTALVTTFSIYGDRAVFVVASWVSQPARVNLTIDWPGLGLAPGSGLKVSAPAVEGWQHAVELGDGAAAPSFDLYHRRVISSDISMSSKGGLIVVASKVV